MDPPPRHSTYRGWQIALVTTGRRKWLAHAARRRRPHLVRMAEGLIPAAVLDELHRQIDRAEAELGDDRPADG